MSARRRVAVIGAGISGLAVAHRLAAEPWRWDVSVFEADRHFGGHAHTVDITLDSPQGRITHGVDTGFLVFNERTYPRLIELFGSLGVQVAPCEMSFSVQHAGSALEWSGTDLNGVFAQRGNLLRPSFLGMLADLLRFNRLCTRLAIAGDAAALRQPIGEFLREHRFGDAFRDWYFLPMIGCIWSCPTSQMLAFPIATMIRFCHNHGLLQIAKRPRWYSVVGGSRIYVQRIVLGLDDARLATPVRQVRRAAAGSTGHGRSGAFVATDEGVEHVDEVVFACHSDQALALLADPREDERAVLGAIGYQRNRAVLHTDAALLPRRQRAWAAWNYERGQDEVRENTAVCLHYLLNRLQPLPFETPVIVSLNPLREPDAQRVLGEFDYAHPVFDQAAIDAQQALSALQGRDSTWFCGAWTRYGFHEDGLASGLAVVAELQQRAADASLRAAA